MTDDLDDRLRDVASTAGTQGRLPSAAQLRRRGDRRRRVQQVTAGALALIVMGSSYTLVAGRGELGGNPTSKSLVSAGAQPVGFTLDKVPAGWKVQESKPGSLILAPPGTVDSPVPMESGNDRARSGVSLVGKVYVNIQSDFGVPDGLRLDKVTVGGRPAVIGHHDDDGPDDTRTLFAKQPSGVYLEIQVWAGLGWDNDRIVEFAESVHITKDAK
jgi:hypothetical protein